MYILNPDGTINKIAMQSVNTAQTNLMQQMQNTPVDQVQQPNMQSEEITNGDDSHDPNCRCKDCIILFVRKQYRKTHPLKLLTFIIIILLLLYFLYITFIRKNIM